MNFKEAYAILEIPETSSPEEAKKKYRELTKKLHPDVNKEPGAEDRFKKINEAYQVISTGKSTDREESSWHSTKVRDPFGRHTTINYQAENIDLYTTISFKDSILGCKKEMKFNRKAKCKDCNGQGETTINNGCDKCGGRGQVVGKHNNMIFIRTCDKCYGRSQTVSCSVCNATGVMDVEADITVSIPGGIHNENILRLNGMGHYMGSFGPLDQYTDAHLHVLVTPEPDLSLDGNDVISKLEITLLEALRGCDKKVNTILGAKNIEIKPLSKNKDEVVISGLGVNRIGNHKVILSVTYPNNVAPLIDTLLHKET